MKRIWALLLLSLLPVVASGQSVSLTGTVTDTPDNQVWTNGTISFTFFGPQGTSYRWTGGTLNVNTPITAALSPIGFYSVSVPDNSQITPTDSSWIVTVCPAVLPAVSACFKTTRVITSASTTLNLTPPSPRFSVPSTPAALTPITAYVDAEISGGWVGFTYSQLTASGSVSTRLCQVVSGNVCTVWTSVAVNSQNGQGPVFNIKGYGAVGDAQHVRDGVTAGGGHTVTSASAHFQTTAKVGQNMVCVANGNATPIMPTSQITVITSDTVVTTNGTDAGALSGLRCTWYTKDDTAAILAAGTAATGALANHDPTSGSPTINPLSASVYCPLGGYAVSGRFFSFITGVGSPNIGPDFRGAGRHKCIFYVLPSATDPGDALGTLIAAFGMNGGYYGGFTINGSGYPFPYSHSIVQFALDSQFIVEDIAISDISPTVGSGIIATLDFNNASSGLVRNVVVQNNSTGNNGFACSFNSGSVGIVAENLGCSNHNQNLLVTNTGVRGVGGANGIVFVGGVMDECGAASSPCHTVTNSGLAIFNGTSLLGNNPAFNVDGTSRAYLNEVYCGIFGSTTAVTNCMTISSGGYVSVTGSDLLGNDSNSTTGAAVSAPVGATFVDVGGNKIRHSVSGVVSDVTPAQYATLGFTGGIVPKSTQTHTPNTCYAVTGNLLATAQNLCTILLDQNYQVLNITAQSGGTTPANSSCSGVPVITMSDGTRTATLQMTSGQTTWSSGGADVHTNVPGQVFASGTTLTVSIGANTCATPPVNVSVNYNLQSVLNP